MTACCTPDDPENQALRPCDDCPAAGVHRPVEGADFMFPEWCGACDACGRAPTVCAWCSYSPDGVPLTLVDWPCQFAAADPPARRADHQALTPGETT